MSDLCVIASYSFAHEAQLTRSRLEAAGVLAFVLDEHTITMNWLYSNALGGVKVAVPTSEAQRAYEILNEEDPPLVLDADAQENVTCAHCGSDQLKPYVRGKKPALLIFLLIGFPLFFYQRGVKCAVCSGFTPES